LPAHRVYQLWFAQAGERPVTGGAFRVNARGETAVAVSVPMPVAKARAIAVTEEPAPMSPAPTGAHLLDSAHAERSAAAERDGHSRARPQTTLTTA
jgi:anti-sigma-K factor RskA